MLYEVITGPWKAHCCAARRANGACRDANASFGPVQLPWRLPHSGFQVSRRRTCPTPAARLAKILRGHALSVRCAPSGPSRRVSPPPRPLPGPVPGARPVITSYSIHYTKLYDSPARNCRPPSRSGFKCMRYSCANNLHQSSVQA